MQKAFINKDGKASISCPACEKTKWMDVSRFKDLDKEIRLKCTCSCGEVFKVAIERRRHYRKAVRLEGNIHCKGRQMPVTVTDLSRCGLKILSESDLELETEEKVVLEFILDDATHSRVSKEMIVKNTHSDYYGLAFASDDHYDRLGNYLAFQLA